MRSEPPKTAYAVFSLCQLIFENRAVKRNRIGPLLTAAWYRMPFHSVPGMQWCKCHGQRPLTDLQIGVGFAVLEFAQQACARPQSGLNTLDEHVVLGVADGLVQTWARRRT